MDKMDRRDHLLMRMYEQLWVSIDRNIRQIWQVVTVLASVIALYTFVFKNEFNILPATIIILSISCWGVLITIDSAFWYLRNYVIVGNIEKQFLESESDLKAIHCYFRSHPKWSLMPIFKIQTGLFLAVNIFSLSFYYFYYDKGIGILITKEFVNYKLIFPLILALGYFLTMVFFYFNRKRAFNKFKKHSPGKKMDGESDDQSTVERNHVKL